MIFTTFQSPTAQSHRATITYQSAKQSHELDVDLLIKLPKGGPLDRAYDQIIGDTILADTRDYGRQDLIDFSGPTGQIIRSETLPDSIHIWFAIRTIDAPALPMIVDSLLFHASLTEADVRKTMLRLKKSREGYWQEGYGGEILPYSDVHLVDLEAAYRRICKPGGDFIAIRGPKPMDTIVSKVANALDSEPPNLDSNYQADPLPPIYSKNGKRSIDTITFLLPSVRVDSPSFAANCLAIFALGSGKGAILFHDLRQKADWSYRQEAFYIPDASGLRPVIEIATAHGGNLPSEAKSARKIILDSLGHLTLEDKTRGIAMAEAVFNRGIGMNPFAYLSHDNSSLFLRNYWQMKSGETFNSTVFLNAMKNVPLDQLKKVAEIEFSKSVLRVVVGR